MTRDKIEWILKRYVYISQAIKKNLSEVVFYVGNRREKVIINDEILLVYEIIKDVRINIAEDWVRKMLDGILKGKSDVSLLFELPCERSMYYDRKRKLVELIYRCCIAKKMITYEQLLQEVSI